MKVIELSNKWYKIYMSAGYGIMIREITEEQAIKLIESGKATELGSSSISKDN